MDIKVNSIVQVLSKGLLDKCFNGCIGFVESIEQHKAVVRFYYPKELGKNPFVIKKEIPMEFLSAVGEPVVNPK